MRFIIHLHPSKHTHILPLPSSKFSHIDVQHSSGRLDHGILILTLPLDLPAHLSFLHTVYGFPILNGVIMLQNVGRNIIGVVYHPVGVHAMEVVLEIRQKQSAHAHRVDEHSIEDVLR